MEIETKRQLFPHIGQYFRFYNLNIWLMVLRLTFKVRRRSGNKYKFKMRSYSSFGIQMGTLDDIWYKILDQYRKIYSDILEDRFQYIGGCNKTSCSTGIEGWEPFAGPLVPAQGYFTHLLQTSCSWDLIDPEYSVMSSMDASKPDIQMKFRFRALGTVKRTMLVIWNERNYLTFKIKETWENRTQR